MNKRTPIGRKLTSQLLATDQPDAKMAQTFTLASGNKVQFNLTSIPADVLATQTFVDPLINGREQEALTQEAVADIARTLPLQQFFPAIGRQSPDGRIEILDGSRRRAAAIYQKLGLEVLVCKEPISAEDARQLAADIQTAREHNLREVGLRLLALRESGMNQKEIAKSQKLSPAKVTRAIQAASVPADILSVFPVQSELTYPDYKLLLDIYTHIEAQGIDPTELVLAVMTERETLLASMSDEQFKNELLHAYKTHSNSLLAKPKKERSIIENLWSFEDKDLYARRKSKNRSISYEFNRMPAGLISELDEQIKATIERHLQKNSPQQNHT